MEAKLPPRLGIVIMLAAATCFASNHVAARIAFDHGASVATGVVVRAAGTALVLFLMMRVQGVRIHVPRPALIAGILVALQSYCLYSAVAIIPAALALLVFQTSPMLFILLSWATGKEVPRWSAVAAILAALLGLVLALNIRIEGLSMRWAEIGAGVSWAFAAAVSFVFVLYANANWLKAVDGKLRTFIMTTVTAIVVLAAGAAADAMKFPVDGQGWLGLALLTVFYCIAMCTLFIVVHRIPPSSTVAMNFEPIALLGLGWVFLGQAVAPLQIAGALVTVGAIAWLGGAKK
ncbi:MAG TPA: DMT family transporter [Burkholderiales bacterium]|nr:DMT family transporter [Burkholderiales bacterium]